MHPVRIATAVIIFLASQRMASAEPLYVLHNFFGQNQLSTIDSNNASATFVGNTAVQVGFGLGDFNGRLFSFNPNTDVIVELNPMTGGTLSTQALGSDEFGEGTIAFRSDGKGFLSSSQGSTGQLRSFDLGVAGNTLIDSNLSPSLDGADFQPGTDIYFGLDQQTGELVIIDPLNGDTTLVGPGIGAPGALAGLTFGSDGTLFGITRAGALFSINPNDGTATFIGNSGLDDVSGLSALGPSQQEQPIPEPASIAVWSLLLVVGIGLVWMRR